MKIIDKASKKAANREKTYTKEIMTRIGNEQKVINVEFDKGSINNYPEITKETITSLGINAVVERVAFNVEVGRDEEPTVYEDIYDTRVDPAFGQFVAVKKGVRGRVVFLERAEGGEVKFGNTDAANKEVVRLVTHSAGFEHTREARIYDEDGLETELELAMGEANNALKNNIHLSPIIDYDYTAANQQPAVTTNPSVGLQVRDTIEAAQSQVLDLPKTGGRFNILLANPRDKYRIERALGAMQVDGTTYPPIGDIDTVIYYDGWEGQVGDVNFEYEGVAPGMAYLIRPKREFKSMIKEDMVLERGSADVSRGIDEQLVGHTTLATWSVIENNVIEITLP